MKSTIFLAFFLLFAFSTTLPSTTADNVVYDTDGQPVTFSGSYHIIPVLRGRGGGLELGKTGNETCPLSVVQACSEVNPGLPVHFLIGVAPSPNVTEGLPLIILFPEQPSCVPGFSSWVVVEEFPIGWTIKVAYSEIRFGPFRIEKYDNYGPHDYKLVYCPGSGNVCADLGFKNRRLIVRDGNPFIVRFKKAVIAGSSAQSLNNIAR